MTWLWVLGVLLFLTVLLCLARVGAKAAVRNGELTLDVKIGFLKLRLLPPKKRAPDPKKEARQAAKAAEAQRKKTAKKETQKAAKALRKEERKGEPLSMKTERLRVVLADVQSAVEAIWPPLKRALNRTRKGVRIDPLQLSLTVGAAEDPAKGAQLYGWFHAGVWTAMPVLEQMLDIPAPYIHVGVDFDSDETKVEGEAGITIRIGTLLAVGFTVAVPALRWFLKWNRKNKQARQPDAVKKG